MEYSHALCRGRSMALCSWITVHSCGWSVTQRETTSVLTLCSVSGSADLWAPSILASHGALRVMLRSTEASSKASEAIRTSSPSGRLSLQPAPISRGCQGITQLLRQTPGRWTPRLPLSCIAKNAMGFFRSETSISTRDSDPSVEGFVEVIWRINYQLQML